MLFLRIVELLLIALVLLTLVTQILIPMSNRTVLFPFFRKSTNDLESEIAEVDAQLHEKELQAILDAKKALLHPETVAPAAEVKTEEKGS